MAERVLKEKRHPGKPGPYCGQCPYKDQPRVKTGGRKGGYMLVGSGPGAPDVKEGRLFAGLTGARLKKQIGYAGILLDDCWVDDVVQCQVPKTRRPTKTAMRCCRPMLEQAMAECQPHTVITLGADAFEAFYPGCKITAYHGARIQGDGYTLVPMYQPNAYDDNPDLLRTIADDYHGLRQKRVLSPIEGSYRMVKAPAMAKTMPAMANDRYSVDTETDGLDLRSRLLGVGYSDTPGEAFYVPAKGHPRGLVFQDHAVMWNAKFDLGILESNGVALVDSWEDVDDAMILCYCRGLKPLGLKARAIQDLQLEMKRFEDVAEGGETLVGVDDKEVAMYNGSDADATLRLWDHHWRAATPTERNLYEKIDKPLPRIMAKMQLAGVSVDVDYFKRLSYKLANQLKAMEDMLRAQYGLPPEVLNSPTALAKWLSALLEVHVPSTEHYEMEKLRGRHPAVDAILLYRPVYKQKTSFVDSILALQRGGLVFPDFNQTRTSTGRAACSKPNMQQLPKRADKDYVIRKGFPARAGCVVAALDNSQIDLRSLAYLSKDEEFNRIFDEDLDVHDETANDLLGNAEETARRLAKTANFLTVFGGGPEALAMKTGAPLDKATAFMQAYWAKHDGTARWVRETHRFLLENGFVQTAYGRRRYIPKVYTSERGAAFREGQNMPVQGTSADVLKLQMDAVARLALPFAQVHDELDFYLPAKGAKELCRELVRAMESVDSPFRLKVEAAMGPNLGELEKADFGRHTNKRR
jgi:DNA polymerase-1